MDNTIWLLAFRRQLFAMNSGARARGLIKQRAPIIKMKEKNTDWKTRNESKAPNSAPRIGIRIENDVAPVGVMFKWIMSIASWIAAAFFWSGFTLRVFSLKLHNFSYKPICFGRNSALNSLYSFVVGVRGASSTF